MNAQRTATDAPKRKPAARKKAAQPTPDAPHQTTGHTALDDLNPRDFIVLKGARMHNLKNVSLAIPRHKLVVFTGLSGSGKSSLVFDTLFAEGQRRYVESLSSYARQFMVRMKKPDVDYIKGLAPAMAIEQKVTARNPRSTVGSVTEVYDYLKLLFARVGRTFSPLSGSEVRRDTITDIVNAITAQPLGTRVEVCAALPKTERAFPEELNILLQKGFTRMRGEDGTLFRIEDLLNPDAPATPEALADAQAAKLLIDRFATAEPTDEALARYADSVQTAYSEGADECTLYFNGVPRPFSDRFELDGIRFEQPTVNLFSYTNPFGACKRCEGFGNVVGIDEDLVIPDRSMSVYEGAVAPWRSDKMVEWKENFIRTALKHDFPVHRSYYDLTKAERDLLWKGKRGVHGINDFFNEVEANAYKVQYRVLQARFRGKTICPECRGSRLRPDANYVKLVHRGPEALIPHADAADPQYPNRFGITDLVLLPVKTLRQFFAGLELTPQQQEIAKRLRTEIENRLLFMDDVGLGYLTLNRLANTLSGGESQRIKLATSLGSNLTGSLYILDEPSIGLHPRDNLRLVAVLERLKALGNTVLVVEHEEAIMQAADYLIDIGPLAGQGGGEVIFQGTYDQLLLAENSLTGEYLSGRRSIALPTHRRKWTDAITLHGVRENNLKNIEASFPLRTLTVVTGVSGSGKTSLIKRVLHPAIAKNFGAFTEKTGLFDRMSGEYTQLVGVEMIDQNPIGKSSRSNPVTFTKAYDGIRTLFADQPLARNKAFKPSTFSFNVEGGRCEACQGEGEITVEMQFLADVQLPCEACHGKRFKDEVLEVEYEGKNISDVLHLTIDEALVYFAGHKTITNRLQPLQDVGMGYVQLGQSSSTLSGGESQRIKLASYLTKGAGATNMLFIFDEPTTGLHFHDIAKLLVALNALVDQGNTVIVIEHNLEVIKSADWLLDLGPEAGDEGGYLVYAGLPEGLKDAKDSQTALFLNGKL